MVSSHPAGLPGRGEFSYGVATASYQVEGAIGADGRTPSIWDTFTQVPGAIRDGSDGATACDSYHRVEEDLALVAGLGVDHYRFSLAWPRILPGGTLAAGVEARGLDYYDRLVDGLLERGISPMPTLYHWDLPQVLEDDGGWLNRDTGRHLADLARVVHDRLGDRVGMWATLNEPYCSAYLGYAAGIHAPGRVLGTGAHVAAHHLLLGHAWAAEALRDAGARDVGIVLNLAPVWPERPEAAEVADGVDAIRNRVWLGPLTDGAYDDGLLAVAPELRDPDVVRDGDLAAVRGSAEWIGINYYTPERPDLAAAGEPAGVPVYPGVEGLVMRPREPLTDIGWEVDARGLTQVLADTHARTGLPVLVCENGAAYHDTVVDGAVDDRARVDYLRDHLAAVTAAREAGVDVRGYVAWTLLDNFEWAEGYTQTFGIVHVDRQTRNRIPKASYHWYATHVGERG